MEGYNVLIVDSNVEHRSLLKQAMRALSVFEKVIFSTRFSDAEKHLTDQEPFDIIFIPSWCGQDAIKKFSHLAKNKMATRDAALILMFESAGLASSYINGLMQGADGFLVAPYSVEQLLEITRLAEKVKTERKKARFNFALRLLVKGIEGQLGQLARLKKRGNNARICERVLKEMCGVLRELDEEMLQEYYDTLVKVFTKLTPTHTRVTKGYMGASQRIRSRASARTLEKFREALAA